MRIRGTCHFIGVGCWSFLASFIAFIFRAISRQLTEIILSRRGTPSAFSPGYLITRSEKGHGKGKENGKEVTMLPYPEISPGIAVRRLDEFIASLTNITAVATGDDTLCFRQSRGVLLPW